jgi:DNA-binding response OmpR family regulator
MTDQRSRQPRLLLIDDDPAAIMLMRIGLDDSGLAVELDTETSFHGGLSKLRGYLERPPAAPDLVIIDLNLGDGSGHDLLEFMQSQPSLAEIPALILSTSSYAKDIERAMAGGAAEYIVKPSSYEELVAILRRLGRYLEPTLVR